MGVRVALVTALVCVLHACGGSEFSGDEPQTGGTGGAGGGTGATAATGGSGGGSGTGASGGTSGSSGSGAGASAGADASVDANSEGAAGEASVDSSVDAVADAGPPPIVVVQASATATVTGTSNATFTMPNPSTLGNSIIVGASCISSYGAVIDAGIVGDCDLPNGSVTDNHGNTYTRVVQGEAIASSQQRARGYVFIARVVTAPTALTVTIDPVGTSGEQGIAAGAIEVSGLVAPPNVDTTGTSTVAQGTSTTATTEYATTQANELAVGVLTIRHNETTAGVTYESSWTQHHIHQNSFSGPPVHSLVTRTTNAAAKISHTWGHVAPSRGAAGVIATFKGAPPN